jgi:hypothetical protein
MSSDGKTAVSRFAMYRYCYKLNDGGTHDAGGKLNLGIDFSQSYLDL